MSALLLGPTGRVITAPNSVATEYLSSMSAWMTQSKHHLDRCMAQIRDAIAGVTIGGMGGYEGQQEAEDSLQALA